MAPCALGGILDHETVPRLRCRIVAGAANNQLASRLGGRSPGRPGHPVGARFRGQRRRDHQHRGGAARYDAAAARRRVRRIGEIILDIFDRADASGTHSAGGGDGPGPGAPGGCSRPPRTGASAARRRPAAALHRPACRGGPRGSRWRPDGVPVGASLHASSSSSSTLRLPRSSAARSRRSRSSRWEMYWSSLASGSWTTGPWPGHRTASRRSLSRLEAVEVGDQRPRIGRDEHASLAEHRVAGERGRAGHEGQVVRRVAGRGHDLERPERVAVGRA